MIHCHCARALLLLTLVFCAPGAARAVTLDDIVELSRAGVTADVLVAVIEADRTIFTLNAQELLVLKEAGVPDEVVVKMLGSSREFAPEPAPEPLIVGTSQPSAPVAFAVPTFVPFPVYVAVPVVPAPVVVRTPAPGIGRFINDGWIEGRRSFGRFINH